MAKVDDLSKSYEQIDYSLRPAKCIERKMICEAFRRLDRFKDVNKYTYIGFGSPFFIDFSLFHKTLKIKDMISIEKHEEDQKRFNFNKPFSCIKLEFGDSNMVLPTLKWNKETILWLDYDFTLDKSILKDVEYTFSSILPGSIILITVDGHVRDEYKNKTKEGERLEQLKKNVGKDVVPLQIKESDLDEWETVKVFKKIIDNKIKQVIKNRNSLLGEDSKITYQQLFNFHYADSAKMLTIGGIIYEESKKTIFSDCKFKDLEFIRFDDDPYEIIVPKFTLREIKYINKFLPCESFNKALNFLPEKDKEDYKKIYPYFPFFAEAEV